ncbi:ABC transporter ATP-binding protein [Simiduia agarivorans]|uniref:Multidrug ABC transporter ATPase n=1 Tax=Simiduia agarivorans (strain DSM 21679 / JCM 13881 / BCRC 17597 / SA1) TaxID=1117647 RepID=K4KRV2_SIMAS|nr:ABC transporter ATP-binding protein [Simiduia agarivorans]AFV00884.1 multidrug ABC transporter ATPase [Simiduia agarivorans SA1 = DSM 21679]
MNSIIQARGLSKRYGGKVALNNVSFDVAPGRIVGLIGPNGAGKTTALKGILGLAQVEGTLQVLGMDPLRQRKALLEQVSFIADTAILPRWIKVSQAIAYVAGVHPRFNIAKAHSFLEKTQIPLGAKVSSLSKGMITQLHLALIMAIDSRLLVLDEPTLGLDILYRKQFYTTLLNDYFDEEKTILVTTHQVEEIETILTDLMFINNGELVLNAEMESLADDFIEVDIKANQKDQAAALQPIHITPRLGGFRVMYERADRTQLAELGSLHTPSITDLFVAKIQPNLSWGQA